MLVGDAGDSAGRILVADDWQTNRELLRQQLEEARFVVALAANGDECIELARTWDPECIILDVKMPGMDGIETCRRLRAELTHLVPVLFVTGHDASDETAAAALDAGGNDFLTKPYSTLTLLARVRSQVSVFRAHARLRELVMHDELTGVFSRRFLLETMRKFVKQASRNASQSLACLMIDIDHFKDVNDEHGHLVGDKVLSRVAATIRDSTRESDVVARFGGEEFAVLLPQTPVEGAHVLAEKIRGNVESASGEISITVSVGISSYIVPSEPEAARAMRIDDIITQLLREADAALYRAKRSGRNCVSD